MHSDKSFVLKKALLNYDSQFSWNIGKYTMFKDIQFKIGSCEVKWKLTIADKGRLCLNIGFGGENLGLHTGKLTFQVPKPRRPKINDNYYPFDLRATEDISISITKNNTRKHECVQKACLHQNMVFSGTITVSNCCCIPKPNMEKFVHENVIQLHKDIQKQWKENLSPDIEIKLGKNCFNAHKFILRARSPVFAKMLEHDMKESRENCITVADTNIIILKNFMSFLYSGNLEDDSFDTTIGLYSLADKYQVTSLQKTCKSLLISKISDSTVLEILKIADLHSDEDLKEEATQFICGRFSMIEVSPDWSSLIDSNIRLASHVLRFVSTKCIISNN